MIKRVYIKGLKSIKEMSVDCSKLNLLVGTNSSGKSTFLQSLLLALQNSIDKVGLNGKWVSIGEFREVRNHYTPREPIEINVSFVDYDLQVEFIEDEKEDKLYRVYTTIEPELFYNDKQDFYYLSSQRRGVSDIYEKNMMNNDDFGVDGEYTLSYLLNKKEEPIAKELVKEYGKDGKITESFLEQVNYWLDDIVDTNLKIEDLKGTNYLQVRYNNNPKVTTQERYCRPINVGSGISYLISIIISCLGSKEDSIIVIENPELHLHPKAQSRLCEFLYFIAKSGRQVFLETHSDHIFNGLRAGVADESIEQGNIKVNFFALNENLETQCNPILFKDFGKIVGTNDEMDINDLFDQFEIDLDRMLGV